MKEFNRNQPTVIVKSWNVNDIAKQIEYLENNPQRIQFVFEFDDYNDYDLLTSAINVIKSKGHNLSCYDFCCQIQNKDLSIKEFENLEKFDKILEDDGSILFFKEFNILWDIEEVALANKNINFVVEKIKKANLSSLEQFLMAYKYTTSKIFKEDLSVNGIVPRSLIGASITENIVCVGYAKILEEIVRRLDNPNLKCYSQSVSCNSDDTKVGHKSSIVYIKDEKYIVNGFLYADSCWDSVKSKDDVMSLAHCLIPIDDTKLFKNNKIESIETSPFFYMFNDAKPTSLLSYSNESVRQFINTQDFINVQLQKTKFIESLSKKDIIEKYNLNNDRLVDAKKPFSNPLIEYSFLKYVCNQIKTTTSFPTYSDFFASLMQVSLKGENMSYENATTYVNQVFEKTKILSPIVFEPVAKNNFNVVGREEINHRKIRMKQLLQKREAAKNKRKNILDSQNGKDSQ